MVEKITNQNQIARHKLAEKINELIDVVDNLQTRLDYHELMYIRNYALDDPTYHKSEPADPYAGQRKWVGKLCLFYDDNYKNIIHYGILTRIDECATILKYEAGLGNWYCACEPVKPDDDIIYKGNK